MQRYRLFLFDPSGRKVDEEREFQALDDQTALELTRGWGCGRKAELWRGNRQVHAWAPGVSMFDAL